MSVPHAVPAMLPMAVTGFVAGAFGLLHRPRAEVEPAATEQHVVAV
ncbi:hypothetical protein [Nocardia sp. R6R-6]